MTLQIAVLVKQVPDINAVRVDAGSRRADLGTSLVMNTYDTYAVSEAISLKERMDAEVTVVSAGPASTREVILRALATGADSGIHVEIGEPNAMDSLAMAQVLADALRDEEIDLIMAGQTTDDYETGQVGPQVAELLGWPHVSLATHIDVVERRLRVTRDAEGSKETVEFPTPGVVMVLSGRDGSQRHPSLRGMMAAKNKPIRSILATLPEKRRLFWSEPVAPVREMEGTILAGLAPAEAATQLVTWLKDRKLV
ncbi:MAG: electron transfer flavoprotein subunit beta/FixA family protein [Chloroflexota bacterium]|nr:electron transfer flavoprotein subunit beta/FixA family protein [Chloroflexota bacterium]